MLTKLALAGIKHRLKDYLVLLTGLVISSAIFYMFANLATNQAFINANTTINVAGQVFKFGMVLLMIITVVYLGYANSFLLSMRQHDYGLFMMLGAKKNRIGQLVVLETLLLGIVATIIGIVVGIGLSAGLSGLLFRQLDLTVKHFSVIYGPAIVTTLCLFVGLFLIAALFNLAKLVKTPVLTLLHSDDQAFVPRNQPMVQALEIIGGVLLLGSGYLAMAKINVLQLSAIPIALVTITTGTYFLFNGLVIGIIQLLKRSNFANHALHNFTLGQIMFRIQSYTRILTIVSLLFALALGAISVGTQLHRQVPQMARSVGAYAVAINDASPKQQRQMNQLDDAKQVTYTQKIVGQKVYYSEQEFLKQPFKIAKTTGETNGQRQLETLSIAQLKADGVNQPEFASLVPKKGQQISEVVSQSAFNRLEAPTHHVTLVKVDDLTSQRNQPLLTQLVKTQQQRFAQDASQMVGTFEWYQFFNSMFGGMEFMGFFLGFAFLAMMASCLMFKILSGATKDVVRYKMLNRIGARQQLMRSAVRGEVLTLFAIPGVLGIVDVLFGLRMFKGLLLDPYAIIGWIILGFCAMYAIYYWITVALYIRLVIPKERVEA
ncbi:FtsX-like permease family protein [Furfurilactobacillus curtus]|uniref:ABC transporter permease n=1 Tax=Furfurilactobacillus curtus TaxID=1746200 RepID=A0ABQ5JNM4_9LACO